MKDKDKIVTTRSFLIYFGIIFLSVLILGQVLYLFLVPGNELREMDERNAYRTRNVHGIRGNIFSTDGEIIATSIPVFTLHWDSHQLEARLPAAFDTLAQGLALTLKGSESHYRSQLKKAAKNKKRYYKIYDEASYEQVKKLMTLPIFNEGQYSSGLIAVDKTKRTFPYKNLAYRTIGIDRDGTDDDVGIEGAYSLYLSGEDGTRLEKRISGGVYIPTETEQNIEAKNGNDVITTLNMHFQDVAENALKEHLMAQKAIAGCAILMEVQTGDILAMANLSLENGRLNESYNIAIGTRMEPGSTFKLASVLALLDDKKASLSDTVIIKNGVKYYYRQEMIDSHIIEPEHIFTLEEAFTESSNAATSWFVYKNYKDKAEQFIKKLHQFELNTLQGIEIPGEPAPFIKDTKHKQWSGVSLPWMSIGYELMLTPLQVLGFYNAVANDGVYVKPRFVKEVKEGHTILLENKVQILNSKIAGNDAIEQVQYLLQQVVEAGTARTAFRNSPYSVAGKTGTAQIHSAESGYQGRNYNASFVGYFPAESPKYSCIVVVNRPGAGRYYASSVAVPVFKEIADKVYASDINIHQDKIDSIKIYNAYNYGNLNDLKVIAETMRYDFPEDYSTWGSVTMNTEGRTEVKNSNTPAQKVPNLKGLGLRDALYLIEKRGMKAIITGTGKVTNQYPESGTNAKPGSMVSITLK